MKAMPAEIEKYLCVIPETPGRIIQATKDLDETHLQFRGDNKSWSVDDILAHLRSCADLWTHSVYAMLAENEPTFSDINERKHTIFTQVRRLAKHETDHVQQIRTLLREK